MATFEKACFELQDDTSVEMLALALTTELKHFFTTLFGQCTAISFETCCHLSCHKRNATELQEADLTGKFSWYSGEIPSNCKNIRNFHVNWQVHE